tara:strand:+ start:186 stop:1103 length:918 start_codon:yes stop_codon:yes gene_type:complete
LRIVFKKIEVDFKYNSIVMPTKESIKKARANCRKNPPKPKPKKGRKKQDRPSHTAAEKKNISKGMKKFNTCVKKKLGSKSVKGVRPAKKLKVKFTKTKVEKKKKKVVKEIKKTGRNARNQAKRLANPGRKERNQAKRKKKAEWIKKNPGKAIKKKVEKKVRTYSLLVEAPYRLDGKFSDHQYEMEKQLGNRMKKNGWTKTVESHKKYDSELGFVTTVSNYSNVTYTITMTPAKMKKWIEKNWDKTVWWKDGYSPKWGGVGQPIAVPLHKVAYLRNSNRQLKWNTFRIKDSDSNKYWLDEFFGGKS